MSEKENVVYTIEDLMKIMPHRYPFLLIDRVTSITGGGADSRLGKKLVARKNVTFNEPYFPGHFPHRPVMPGVLQIETMAQAGAICAYEPDKEPQDVAIVSVSDAKFRRPVIPGDTLEIHVEITKDRKSLVALRCEAFVDGVKAAEADILAKVFPMRDS